MKDHVSHAISHTTNRVAHHLRLCAVCLLTLLVFLSFCMVSCTGHDDTAENTDTTTAADRPAVTIADGYHVAEMVYVSPLSSFFPEQQTLPDETKYYVLMSQSAFSVTFDEKSTDIISPRYVTLAEEQAFVDVPAATTEETPTLHTAVYIRLCDGEDTNVCALQTKDFSDYEERRALMVCDKDGMDTGYTVYFLDDMILVGYYADRGTVTPNDYIMKLDV